MIGTTVYRVMMSFQKHFRRRDPSRRDWFYFGGMQMRSKFIMAIVAAYCLLLLSSPVFAHHSMSIYDMSQTVTMKAKITDFDWSNPHVQIHFDVKDDKGNVENWLAECPGPNRLAKGGWTKDTLKSQDEITITGNPTKDGSKSIRLASVVLPNGQELRGRIR
jgi:hypothetical protein